MHNSEAFFIDVLNILPNDVECFVQSTFTKYNFEIDLLFNTEDDFIKLIKFNERSKRIFFEIAKSNCLVETFNKIDIMQNGNRLFQGYDGVEFGIFSKAVTIPEWFKEKYTIQDVYGVSNEW